MDIGPQHIPHYAYMLHTHCAVKTKLSSCTALYFLKKGKQWTSVSHSQDCVLGACFSRQYKGSVTYYTIWLNQALLECGPMPNVMAALPTTGGALCWTPQFGWRPLLACRPVTLPTRETRWNLQGCPKLANRSQSLVGRSSPYYEDMWRRYRCLTSFFPIVDTCLSCEDTARQSCAMVPKWQFFASCIFSEPRAAHFRPAF